MLDEVSRWRLRALGYVTRPLAEVGDVEDPAGKAHTLASLAVTFASACPASQCPCHRPALGRRSAVKDVFSGFVKQLNPARGGRHFREVFGKCFPEFEYQVGAYGELGVKTVFTSTGVYDVEKGRRRRFAGGPDLPVSRYYAVCSDSAGNDAGTMCYELMTYWSGRASGQVFPSMFDTSAHPGVADFLTSLRDFISDSPDPAYRAEVDALIGSGKPFLSITPMRPRESVQQTAAAEEFVDYPAVCELTVKELTVPDCLDLRREAHREYFCTELVSVEPINSRAQFVGTRHESTIDFVSVLSAMIFPELGGEMFHAAVGQVLRQRGYQGLVYPSARNDSKVVNVGGELAEYSGWNFLDYRGAPPIKNPRREYAVPITPVHQQALSDLGVQAYLIDRHQWRGAEREATGYLTEDVAAQEWRRIDYELAAMAEGGSLGFFYDRFSLRPLRD
jgi:hypothetical protein